MQPINAVVKNGRLTLDVPSDLPDGEIVPLLPLHELLAVADGFDSSGPVSFQIVPPVRTFVERRPIDAATLLDELRAL
jgi:hypothetical protein